MIGFLGQRGSIVNRHFWAGKKVFVTGHTGFKGGWLSVWLKSLGAEVVGYALEPATDPSFYVAAEVEEGITSVFGDVRDLPALRSAMEQHAPEIVIHLAAQALVKTAYADPVATFTTNIVGTVNVLETVRGCPSVRVLVCITSDKCYDNLGWVWGYRENDRLGGHDPYSASKAGAELVIASYRESFLRIDESAAQGVMVASARAGNVIGGGDWSPDRLVPDTVKAIMAGEAVRIRRPHATRPWQFVLEPLRGYLLLAERLWERDSRYAEAWNFGPDVEESKPVEWIADYLTKRWGNGASWALDGTAHPPEDQFLKLDCAKAKAVLGWRPALKLDTVLDWVVEWYKEFQSGAKLRRKTEAQIARYESLVVK